MCRSRVLVAFIVLLPLALSACERRTPVALTTQPADPQLEIDLKPLTPLLPRRPTHIAADPLGNMYWVQEADRADDTLFVIGAGDIPRATQLSAASIALKLGASGGRGNIHGIAAGNRGEIYFYFQGRLGRQTLAALGQFHPKEGRIRLLAGTDEIASATGMGRSLPLARGTLVADGRNVYLCLRHSDIWAMFRFDPTGLAEEGPIQLTKPFEAVTLDGKPIAMTRPDLALSPAGNGALFLLDPSNARLLRVAPDGVAKLERSLRGLPSILSTPAIDAKGQMLLFAANAPPLGKSAPATQLSRGEPPLLSPAEALASPQQGNSQEIDATYPSLLIFQPDGRVKSISRDHINVYPGFPVYAMKLTQLVPHPRASAWLTYDSQSGEFLLLTIRQREW